MSIAQKCKVEGCTYKLALDSRSGKRYLTKGLCKIHYNRHYLYNDVNFNHYRQRKHIACGDYVKIPTNIDGLYLILDNKFSHADDRLWSVDSSGYAISRKERAHVMVMGRQPVGMDIDHINGDKLDNRRVNLRVISHRQNCHNTKMYSNNTTGYRGVWVDNREKHPVYNAQISKYVNGKKKTIILGRFKTAEEAAIARDNAVRKEYGEFAYLNFPELKHK